MALITEWWWADTAVMLVTILGLLYYYATCTFSYWARKGVKSVPDPKVVVGNMGPVFSQSISSFEHFDNMYNALAGEKFGGFYKMRQPALLVRDPEIIKNILAKDFQHFHDNDIHANEKVDPLLAYNIFTMKGAKWKYARSKLTSNFSTGKIRNMFPLIMNVCDELKAHLQRRIASGDTTLNVKRLAANYTTDVVGSVAYGIRCNSLQDESNQFRRMGDAIMIPTKSRALLMSLVLFFPSAADILGSLDIKFFTDATIKFFSDMITETMKFREKNGVHRNDLVDHLIQLNKEGQIDEDDVATGKLAVKKDVKSEERKFEFTHDFLTAQAVNFFFDGYETSSLAIAFALHELALNPDVQQNLREELQEVIKSSGGQLTYDAIRECQYLDQVHMETQRMHTAFAAMSKVCTQTYQIPNSEVYIEAGTTIFIPIDAIHRDPKYFPNPGKFDPDRFSEQRKKNIVPGTFLPFGEGPRQCIGMRFAQAQVKAALATIVTNFEIKRAPNTLDVVKSDPNSLIFFMLSPVGGLPLTIAPLTKA